jgi:protease-4
MSMDSDVIVDRRRMRRKLTFWRVASVIIAIAAIGIVAMLASSGSRGGFADSSIARVNIEGLIRSDRERVEALERLEKSTTAAAVIVHINSPGGTTAGSEQLYDSLVRLKAKKPLVVVGCLRRLHHRDRRRPHHCAADFAGRLDRRAVPVS